MSVKLAARTEGEGVAILLLHGLFGSGRNWFSVARNLAANWKVSAIDLRNHGASPWGDSMTYPEMAGDVLSYLDQHRIDRAVVLGHSMGGKVAMTLADLVPERIAALIAVDIAPVYYEPSKRPFLEGMMALDIAKIKSRRDADNMLASAVPEPGVRGFLLQNLVQSDGAYRWRINLAAIDAQLERKGIELTLTNADTYSFPVQAIYGESSAYMNSAARSQMQSIYPNCEFAPIPDAGHWVHAEQPALFQTALDRFLASL